MAGTSNTIYDTHNIIMAACKAIRAWFMQTQPTNPIILHSYNRLREYMSKVAAYLLDGDDELGYEVFVALSGVVVAINNIARRTNCITPIDITTVVESQETVCLDCGGSMVVCDMAEVCRTCGAVLANCDTSEYSGEHGKPNKNEQHSRHFGKHIARAQAMETTNIPIDIIERAKDEIPDSGIDVTKWLKRNKFNKHTPDVNYIVRCVYGYNPPEINNIERREIDRLFREVSQAMVYLYPDKSLSYRYILYKLIDSAVKDADRRDEMLACVYLPFTRTLNKLDKQWVTVCSYLNIDVLIAQKTVRISHARVLEYRNAGN